VLGCGTLAREVLLPVLGRIPQVEVAVIADLDHAARDAAASLAPGARPLSDWRDALAQDVDAVVVALPTALHAEAAIAVIEAGKHLYLEKPIAATVEEGLLLEETARRVGLGWVGLKSRPHTAAIAMVGFNYRFNPLIVELRQRVQNAEVGAPRVIRTTFSTKATPGATWRRPDRLGGGVLLDLGSHHIDLVRYITGDEIASVRAARTMSSEGAEHVALTIQLTRGAVVQSVFATGTEDVDRIEIEGERGSLTVDRYRSWVVQRSAGGSSVLARGLRELGGWRYALEKRRSPWHEPSFARGLEAFVAAARSAEQQGASLEDGLRSLQAIDAAERSWREGRIVELAARTDSPQAHRSGRT
jgi:predicted dehydrogenase